MNGSIYVKKKSDEVCCLFVRIMRAKALSGRMDGGVDVQGKQ